MNKFLLQLSPGKPVTAETSKRDQFVQVKLGNQEFTFNLDDLTQWQGEGYFTRGQFLVSTPILQRAFDFQVFQEGQAEQGPQQLQALFPGKVIKILAKEKNWADKDDLLVVMESMKMEYNYHAPKKLWIEKILVKEGETLTKGQAFFQLRDE